MSLDYGLLRSDTLLKQGCKIIEGVLVFNHTGQVPLPLVLWEQTLQDPEVDERHSSVGSEGRMSWTGESQGCALICCRNTYQPLLPPDAALPYHPPPHRAACICHEFI